MSTNFEDQVLCDAALMLVFSKKDSRLGYESAGTKPKKKDMRMSYNLCRHERSDGFSVA